MGNTVTKKRKRVVNFIQGKGTENNEGSNKTNQQLGNKASGAENNREGAPGREGAGTSVTRNYQGNSDLGKAAGTSSPSVNVNIAQGQEIDKTANEKEEPKMRDENSSSPSGDNARYAATKTKLPSSSAALPEGRESEGTSTSSHNQATTEPENPASPSSESPIEGGKKDKAPTPEDDKKAEPAPTSGSQGKGDTTAQVQENSTATEENKGGEEPSSSGEHAQLNGDTKRKPATTSAELPKRRENGGATSTSSHNKISTEPENPASPSSESLIEGGEEDQAKNTTTDDDKKAAAEPAPTSGSQGKGDTTAQVQENNTTTEENKEGGKPSSSGEHAQLNMRSGVTVTSTAGPGDPGIDHRQNSTNHIPDSDPPPQSPVAGKRPPVIPERHKKRKAAETEPREQPRAVIFSLEEDDGVKSLEKWTRSFIPDCQHISPTTTKDWRAAVETSAIVIVYSSSSSYRSFTEKMGQYMDHWKGYEKVIVVIGDVPASEDAVKSGWDGGRWPRCEVHVFTKTERRWILQDPRMQKMSGKIREIREIVLRDYKNKRISVKILSLSGNPEPQKPEKKETPWLVPLLRDDEKVDFTFCQISDIKKLPSKLKESGPICILLFTKETFQKINEEKKNSDQQYTMKLKGAGQKHLSVVVVVDDLDDESLENDVRSLYNKSGYSSLWSLFLFRREERRPEYLDYVSSEVTAKEKWCKLQESMESRMRRPESCDTPDATPRPPPADNEDDTRTPGNLGIVGIFSRSSNTDYSWIEQQLKSPDLAPVVSEVRPFYISNNQTVKFYEELGRCFFGILYHTKNRGRVNVTDVTDSLYDEELEAMSQILNRENVIVVIDDLRDSHIEEKGRILKTQPSIDRYAFDLLLFSEQDKKDGEHIVKLTEAIKLLVAGKKTSGTSNSRKNQPQINGNNIDNPEEQSTDNSNITSISTPL